MLKPSERRQIAFVNKVVGWLLVDQWFSNWGQREIFKASAIRSLKSYL